MVVVCEKKVEFVIFPGWAINDLGKHVVSDEVKERFTRFKSFRAWCEFEVWVTQSMLGKLKSLIMFIYRGVFLPSEGQGCAARAS